VKKKEEEGEAACCKHPPPSCPKRYCAIAMRSLEQGMKPEKKFTKPRKGKAK